MPELPEPDERLVAVLPEWNGWRTASVRLADVQDVHWREPEGARRPVLHAHVACTDIVSGDLEHECRASATPHRLLVCILKSRNAAGVYGELARRADLAAEEPIGRGRLAAARPLSDPPPRHVRAGGFARALWLSVGAIGLLVAVTSLGWRSRPHAAARA